MQEQCLRAGKKLVRFNSRPGVRSSETPRRNEAREAGTQQTMHALGGHGQCSLLEFMLNCSGLDAEGKSTGGRPMVRRQPQSKKEG